MTQTILHCNNIRTHVFISHACGIWVFFVLLDLTESSRYLNHFGGEFLHYMSFFIDNHRVYLMIHKSWQRSHFCTTSKGNKLETVKTWINFNANLHLNLKWSDWFLYSIIFKIKQYKNAANIVNFLYYVKTRLKNTLLQYSLQ